MSVTTEVFGHTYGLSTTLRVAYMVQGQHNHKPYTEIFQNMGNMTIEQQIDVLYAAFKCANPFDAKSISAQQFRDYYLDHYNLHQVMDQLQAVIRGILGDNESDAEADADNETSEGNM